MNDKDLDGRLVFLTVHMDRWLREVNADFDVPMANRLARVIKVFDWDTEEGRILLQEREKTGKWKNLNARDFKYILNIYNPDLIRNNKIGCITPEVAPRCYPGTELALFDLVPEWMLKEINKEQKNVLKIEKKKNAVPKRTVRKKTVRKTVAK